MERLTIITNNPLVLRKFSDQYDVQYHDCSHRELLTLVRDAVHRGHVLKSHPISGSVKPNHSPCKSVIISQEPGETHTDSVMIIENAIITLDKLGTPREYHREALFDFQTVDLALIEGALC